MRFSARLCVAAVLALLSASPVAAAVKYYAANPDSRGLAMLDAPVEFPCCITGTVRKITTGPVPYCQVMFSPRQSSNASAAVVPNAGGGVVYGATLSDGEGYEIGLLSAKPVTCSLSRGMQYIASVVASTNLTNLTGCSFAIRFGETGRIPVAFDGNGGTASTNAVSYQPGQAYGALPTAYRAGHAFTGWATAATNGLAVTSNAVACLSYSTLYAQWRATSVGPVTPTNDVPPAVTNYYVAFNANGGTGSMATQTFAYGEAKALSANLFARTNYTFAGWATSPAGGVAYADRAVVSNLASTAGATVPLYASWKKSSAQVRRAVVDGVTWSYTEEGGSATVENFSSDSGASIPAISQTFRGRLVIPAQLGTNVVEAIGEAAFRGCAGITEVVIPETVTRIGSEAFADCSGLSAGVTIPDSVETMGAAVFSGCEGLKIVRYFGDCPDVDADLYRGAPARLVTGVLRGHAGWAEEVDVEVSRPAGGDDEDDEDDDGDDTVTVLRLPDRWPDGAHGRGIYWLTDVKQFTVSLDANGGRLDEDAPRLLYYLPGKRLGDLPEPERTEANSELAFDGWFTAKTGGTRVDGDFRVTANLKLYAHWKRESERETSEWEEQLWDDGEEVNLAAAAVYDGYLYATEGSNDCQVVGSVTVKLAKGRYDRAEEGTNAAVTATVQLLGAKKATFRGRVDESGAGTLTRTGAAEDEDALEIALTRNGLTGALGDYAVAGARNVTGSIRTVDKQLVSSALARWSGTWSVALRAVDAEGDGAAQAENCLCVLTATVGAKGRTKVSGMLSDGTKISTSAQMIFGDGCACVPVVAPLYSGRAGGLALLLWFATDEESPFAAWGVSDWLAETARAPFRARLEPVAAGRAGALSGPAVFALEGGFELPGQSVDETLLPLEVPFGVSAARWVLPAADRVVFAREDETYEVRGENGNPAALKLSFTARDGRFKGSFSVFGVTDEGRSRKTKATVFGAVIDGAGYGSAYIRNAGGAPVTVGVE